jgi:alpha-L-fucosidase 2
MIKNLIILSFTFLLAILAGCTGTGSDERINPSLVLHYDKPAGTWTEALPVGNGRLAAMVYGGTASEMIQFNEETLWAGQPHDYAHEGAYKYLDTLRQMLWEGKQREAHKLANEQFMSQPFGQFCYQPFGNILLDFPGHENVQNYQRRLSLEDAVSAVSYEIDGTVFSREVIASNPGQVIVVRLESSKKGKLHFKAAMNSPHADHSVSVQGNEIILKGKANNYHQEKGMDGFPYPESRITFEARLKLVSDGGEIKASENSIEITGARGATLYLVAATSFISYDAIGADPSQRCIETLNSLEGKKYVQLKSDHIKDHQNLFNRVNIDLGQSELSMRPTDQRLISFNEDIDPSLVALLYQYGRYLLIASSRPGTQPANLQGIWNDRMAPPWDSKYTININAEMNYWPSEITNLSECTEPLIRMVEELAVTGKNVAREHYNMSGWVAHHNTDIWRGAAPINNANHGIWVTGGAWLCQHLWWHYEFGGDKQYLRETAFPVLLEASRFFTEYLVSDPENPEWLISGPSNSPEIGGLVMGPAMDHQIIRNLFDNTLEAAVILNIEDDLLQVIREKRNRIAPDQIGRHGQLQEWLEDLDDPTNEHRHVSHLWALHPGSEIHPLTTPDLANACRVTLSHRGDGGTGWSRAWKVNFWARLLDGDHSFLLLRNLMVPSISQDVDMRDMGGLYLNLFDSHPPFQIDGNFGATSGITEMLLQSHLRNEKGEYFQDLLPALPSALASGKISGIRGRGGFTFDITWEKGKPAEVKVRSDRGNKLNLRYSGKTMEQETIAGKVYSFKSSDF